MTPQEEIEKLKMKLEIEKAAREGFEKGLKDAAVAREAELSLEVERLRNAMDKACSAFWMRQSVDGGHSETFFSESSKGLPIALFAKVLTNPAPPGLGAKMLEMAKIAATPENWVYTDPNDGYQGGGWSPSWFFRGTEALKKVKDSISPEELKALGVEG